jgi:pimeloyl-ACP methyl ester carboxylesterase
MPKWVIGLASALQVGGATASPAPGADKGPQSPRMANPQLHSVRTASLDIAYEASGRKGGTPVILLHGFPDDPRAYDGALDGLDALGCRVLVPWLRGYGPTRFLDPATPRSGQQAALGTDLLAFMDTLGIGSAVLVGYDWGGRAACIVAALWPERCLGLVTIGGYNVQDIALANRPQPAINEYRAWYQHYFNTERGRAGLEQNRRDISRMLWELWSPNWKFDDATFERTAVSFDNPDFVEVVIHSYRHRRGAAEGDPALEAIERRLSEQPPIAVPTVAIYGEADGVTPPTDEHDRAHFSGLYERRVIPIAGHFLPHEAPAAVVAAVETLLGSGAGR